MQPAQVEARRRGNRTHRKQGALDLAHTRHEHQHVALHLGRQLRRVLGRTLTEILALPKRRMTHMHGMGPSLDVQPLGAERAREAIRVERGAHHDQLQIRPRRFLHPTHRRDRQVRLQAALVELVDHDGAHAVEARRLEQHAEEHALGQEADPHLLAPRRVEARAPAHAVTRTGALLARHAPRDHARGEPARLEHQHLTRQSGLEDQLRHLRGLA